MLGTSGHTGETYSPIPSTISTAKMNPPSLKSRISISISPSSTYLFMENLWCSIQGWKRINQNTVLTSTETLKIIFSKTNHHLQLHNCMQQMEIPLRLSPATNKEAKRLGQGRTKRLRNQPILTKTNTTRTSSLT